MTKEMIISANGHETMVAILEEDLVTEIFVERERQRGVVGNIYKGRVSKVLPGMQCAFIDLGLERDGFLYVSDVIDTIEEFELICGQAQCRQHFRVELFQRHRGVLGDATVEQRPPAQNSHHQFGGEAMVSRR